MPERSPIPAQSQSAHHRAQRHGQLYGPGQTTDQTAGQIQLANFTNPGGLNSIGNGPFHAH